MDIVDFNINIVRDVSPSWHTCISNILYDRLGTNID